MCIQWLALISFYICSILLRQWPDSEAGPDRYLRFQQAVSRRGARLAHGGAAADPGPPRTVAIPGLQRTTPRKSASCCAAPGKRGL